jgi:hypothetical protein
MFFKSLIKLINFYKIGFLVSLVISTYQVIDLIITYNKYETVIDLKASKYLQEIPSITLCVETKHDLHKIIKNKSNNETVGNYIYRSVKCLIGLQSNKTEIFECNKITTIVESMTSFSNYCVTYFSQLLDTNSSQYDEMSIQMKIYNDLNLFALIHPTRTPSHLFRDRITVKSKTYSFIVFSSIKEHLLPFPHETRCFNYEQNSYKSKEDCIVKNMQRLEVNQCKCNRSWFYEFLNFNSSNYDICKLKNCKFRYNKNLFKDLCPRNCYNEYYRFLSRIGNKVYDIRKYSMLSLRKTELFEVCFTHSPKMNFVDFLCSMGGLISMWFGISVYSFYQYIEKLFLVFIEKFHSLFRIKLNKTIKLFLHKSYKWIVILIFFCLMLIQIMELMSNYLDYETITRIQISEQKDLPKFSVYTPTFYVDFDKLENIYPEIKTEIKTKNKNKWEEKLDYYKLKILSEFGFKLSELVFNPRDIIKSCHLVIKSHNIDCKTVDINIFHTNSLFIVNSLFGNLNESEKLKLSESGIEENLEKIVITLNLSFAKISFFQFVSSSKFHILDPYMIQDNTKTNIYYSSNTIQKLNTKRYSCDSSYNNDMIFGNDFRDKCLTQCFITESNKTIGCLPLQLSDFFIPINNEIEFNKFQLCPINMSFNEKIIWNLRDLCLGKCIVSCSNKYYYIKGKMIGSSHQTIINLIPKSLPLIKYSETLKTDFDNLIYNFGGLFGLWFGLSAISISDLALIMKSLFEYLIFRNKSLNTIRIFFYWFIYYNEKFYKYLRSYFSIN